MDGKSKLFKYGGEGCIFIPELPCNSQKKTKKRKRRGSKNKRKKKKSTKRKTKLLFSEIPSNEIKISKIIRKSDNYHDWCILWDNTCISKDYKSLKKVSNVEECFTKADKVLPKEKQKFKLLQGDFVGRTATNYYSTVFTKEVLNDKTKFINSFIQLFQSMQSLFLGLISLQNLKICHNDIKADNTIFYEGKLYYIDFGLSLKFNETKSLIKRMKEEFNTGRIYEAYSFEYIYYPKLTEDEIKYEEEDIVFGEHRKDYEFCQYIHEELFGRDLDHIRYKLLKDEYHKVHKPNINALIRKIDTYSLGVLPIMILIDSCIRNKLDIHLLIQQLLNKELKPYLGLLYDMTEPNYRDRITSKEAYDRYKNLISVSDTNQSNQSKTTTEEQTKRTNRERTN